jgi:Xaa-Pro aminopeptidase
MGCRLDGYCSDITRMIWVGEAPSDAWCRIHAVVDEARAAAIWTVRSGVSGREVDAAARQVITDAGLGEAFPHGTGHGVGLDIHEAPTLSVRGDEPLRPGMVTTIEPAVYLSGEHGVRIEDMILVTDDGCERLTTLGTEPILRRFC